MNILITNKDWGGCHLEIDFRKIDLLPRITLSEFTGCLVLNIGFLMLTFNLCIFSSDLKEFNRKLRLGELDDKIKSCKNIGELMDIAKEESEEREEE